MAGFCQAGRRRPAGIYFGLPQGPAGFGSGWSVLSPTACDRPGSRDRADKSAPPLPADSSADIGSLRRAASPRANSDATPCDIDQICSAIINAGGRGVPGGASAASRSAAARMMPKARSLAANNAGLTSTAKPGFEHRRIERRLLARKGKIGLADPLECRDRIRTPVIPGRVQAPPRTARNRAGRCWTAVRRGRENAGKALPG